jgi:hypothetical protein
MGHPKLLQKFSKLLLPGRLVETFGTTRGWKIGIERENIL